MTIKLFGTLTASSTDGLLEGLLMPYGTPGRTSAGTVTASQGSVTIPAEVSSLPINEEHDPTRPIGRFQTITDTPEGLACTVKLADTQAGRDAAILAAEGLRTGISVEIGDPVIKAGRLTAGRLTGAALVVRPAFDTARLVTASDTDPETSKENTTMDEEETPTKPPAKPDLQTNEAPSPQAPALMTAGDSTAELGSLTFSAMQAGGGAAQLTAALEDLTTDLDKGKFYIRDQEIGKLFDSRRVNRPLINSVRNRELTSLVVRGVKRNRGFTVEDWAGNKTEIPSSKFTTEEVFVKASAMAGAVDIAMELIEFGSEDIVSDVYSDGLDSYLEKSEAKFRKSLLEGVTNGGTGASIFDIVDKAGEVLAGIGAQMSFISVAADVFSSLVNLETSKAPWWLTSGAGGLSLRERTANGGGVTFSVNPDLKKGQVLIGDSRAATFYESKEFRYRALDLPRGGIDVSLIRFNASMIEDPRAILLYTLAGSTSAGNSTNG